MPLHGNLPVIALSAKCSAHQEIQALQMKTRQCADTVANVCRIFLLDTNKLAASSVVFLVTIIL